MNVTSHEIDLQGPSLASRRVVRAANKKRESHSEFGSDSAAKAATSGSQKSNEIYNFDSLPEEVWERVDEHLIRIDPVAIVRLNATSKALRGVDALKSDTIDISCVHKMTELRYRLLDASRGPYNFDKQSLENMLSQVRELGLRHRRVPLARIAKLANYDISEGAENSIASIHADVFSEVKKLHDIDVGEVLQILLESLEFQVTSKRTNSATRLLDFLESANLPRKHTLYASASYGVSSLGMDALPLYLKLKSLISALPESDRIQPLAHLARVVSKLDPVSANSELAYFKKLIDVQNNPESIYILHGLLRAPQGFSNETQLELLKDANEALRHIKLPKKIFSHVTARVEFIQRIAEPLRIRALSESIDALVQVRPPFGQYRSDIYAWQFETLVPLFGTIPACPKSPERGMVGQKLFGHLRYKGPGKPKSFTFLDRTREPGIGFYWAQDELMDLHELYEERAPPSE